MKLIDTHCHLTFEQLAGDIESVLARSRAALMISKTAALMISRFLFLMSF